MKNLFKKAFGVFCFMVVTVFLPAQSEQLPDQKAMDQLSNEVVKYFAENYVARAVGAMEPYWPIPQNEIDAFEEKSMKWFNFFEQNYGASIGQHKVKREKIADIAIRDTYIIRYKITAVRLMFTYYKSDNGWIINSFEWDDSFTEEFRIE